MPTRCRLGAIHTAKLLFAMAKVENVAEYITNAATRIFVFELFCMSPQLSKLALRASGAFGHTSPAVV
jgi:hypothetical protein